MSKKADGWYSSHLERDIEIARWGDYGTPVIVFPTAGGDAEEIERFHLVSACGELLDTGRIKIYSVDSANGRAMLVNEGDAAHQSWLLDQFMYFLRYELVPAINADCDTDHIEMITAGSSIGAFNALGAMCRFPDVIKGAICMSGTYRLRRFLKGEPTAHFSHASPTEFVPQLEDGEHLHQLRQRMAIFASGEGANEDIGESWHAAHVLGEAGIPNRVDSWGPEWPHDWQTWRAMLPGYLHELLER